MNRPASISWAQIDALFAAALERETSERAAFVRAKAGEETELAQTVLRLLDEAEAAQQLFGDSAADFLAPILPGLLDHLEQHDHLADQGPQDEHEAWPAGTLLGPYKLAEAIGHGGMGYVYRAVRADGQHDRVVAIKLIKRGMDSDAILRRFRREQQILARLEHPHIARLYDGGRSETGQPYFVMEFVDGLPITTYGMQHGLDPTTKLRLMLQVCRAVQFAHQNLVVHRDLKPSNILVTEAGRVKLLDFGIAKLLDAPDEEVNAATRTGQQVLTPAYAAPEQAAGDAITTATDTYALGVVMYEMLTGQRPPRKGPVPPPSAVASESQRQLRGDVDLIVQKALRREPERRYATAEALHDDLQRYLDGLPVRARPDAMSYRFRKFIQRNRTGVAAASAVLLLILFFSAMLVAEQQQTARERDRAQQEAQTAEAVTQFLVNLFAASDPSEARGDSLSGRQLLDRGAVRIGTDLADEPVVQGRLNTVLGSIYSNLGLYEEALLHLEKGEQQYATARSVPNLQLADVHNHLGTAHWELGHYEEAETYFRTALALRLEQLGPDAAPVTELQNNLALLFTDTGDYATADSFYQVALATNRRVQGSQTDEVASNLNNLALLAYRRGDLLAAARYLEEAVDIRREVLGTDHPKFLTSLGNLAAVQHLSGDLEAAAPTYAEVLAVRRAVLGPAHPDVANSLNNYADLRRQQGNLVAAESLFTEALEINRLALGIDHPEVGMNLINLGSLWRQQERYAEAEVVLEEAVRLFRDRLGEAHPRYAKALATLGATHVQQDACAVAEPLLREAITVYTDALGTSHPDRAETQVDLAACLVGAEQFEQAEKLLLEAYPILREQHGDDHPATRMARDRLAELYTAWGRPEDAARYMVLADE